MSPYRLNRLEQRLDSVLSVFVADLELGVKDVVPAPPRITHRLLHRRGKETSVERFAEQASERLRPCRWVRLKSASEKSLELTACHDERAIPVPLRHEPSQPVLLFFRNGKMSAEPRRDQHDEFLVL